MYQLPFLFRTAKRSGSLIAIRVAEGDISKSNLCNIVMIIFGSPLSAVRREVSFCPCASALPQAHGYLFLSPVAHSKEGLNAPYFLRTYSPPRSGGLYDHTSHITRNITYYTQVLYSM